MTWFGLIAIVILITYISFLIYIHVLDIVGDLLSRVPRASYRYSLQTLICNRKICWTNCFISKYLIFLFLSLYLYTYKYSFGFLSLYIYPRFYSLSESHPECLPPSQRITSFFQPFVPSNQYKSQIDSTITTLEAQAIKEKEKVAKDSSNNNNNSNSISSSSNIRRPLRLVPPEPIPSSAFHSPRLVLSHLGFLSLDNLKRFYPIDDNARFRRSLKDLDKISGRQVLKSGVVYVAEGQEDQKSIFRNDAGSKEYNDFLKGLGWSVSSRKIYKW